MSYAGLCVHKDSERGDSLDDAEALYVLQADFCEWELCVLQADFCEWEPCAFGLGFYEQGPCAFGLGFYEQEPCAFGLGLIYVQRVEICADRDAAQPYVADGFEKHHDGLLLRLEYRRGEKR